MITPVRFDCCTVTNIIIINLVTARHPDIVVIDKLQKTVDVLVSSDSNVAQKKTKLKSTGICQLNSHHYGE